jgi:diaminohydroxyphosphoribosylaminopyrimidine deaminase / 5-amino-6-(5-phosphoribosylamino)uracil reductase
MFSESDHQFMQRALELAALGRFTTSPNPNVGAVVVKDGVIVGEGYHQQAGGPHAEVFALRQAAEKAKGATCYVTLEPCSHYGRTPPCALALIDAGVSRVVVAMTDPNPQVSGRGIALLQNAGIEVQSGLLENEARALNPGFLHKMLYQLPYVQLKLAASIDGRTALKNGVSKWLTGVEARQDVQHLRARSCAILSTAETVLCDAALLNVRAPEVTPLENGTIRQPLRIILDQQCRLTGQEPLFLQGGDIILLHQAKDSWPPLQLTESAQLKVQRHAVELACDGRFDLKAVIAFIATLPVNLLWVEAGASLASSLWQQQLVDELVLYQAPVLLGPDARPMLQFAELTDMNQAPRLNWFDIQQFGVDLRLRAKVKGQ